MVNTALLKSARIAAGYNQQQAADVIECTTNTYCDKENGKSKFDIVEALALCSAFNIEDLTMRSKIFLP